MARPREGKFVKITYSGKADEAVITEAREKAEKEDITFSKLLEKLMIGYNEGRYRLKVSDSKK